MCEADRALESPSSELCSNKQNHNNRTNYDWPFVLCYSKSVKHKQNLLRSPKGIQRAPEMIESTGGLN